MANGVIVVGVIAVKADVYLIYKTFHQRGCRASVDHIGVAVCIESYGNSVFFEVLCRFKHGLKLISRLSETAEYHFFISMEVLRQLIYDVFRTWLLCKPQRLTFEAVSAVSYAKVAAVRAFIGQIYIQIAVGFINIGI